MRMKTFGGRMTHQPLSFSFSMVETGGSYTQKYNAVTGEYTPDRNITPYRIQPRLIVDDPDGLIPTGDYATSMVNVIWTLTLVPAKGSAVQLEDKGASGTTYTVDDSNSVNIMQNVPLGYVLHIQFHGEYYNDDRKETQKFDWAKDMATQEQSDTNITIDLRCSSKMNFSPFKNYGTDNHFPIEAVVRNGMTELTADQSVIKWQTFDKSLSTPAWRDIDEDEDLWYISGKDTGKIVVNVDYIQSVLLRVTGQAKNGSTQQASAATLLRRWYGQWHDEYGFSYSQFLTQETKKVGIYAKITNRQGDIKDPQMYFDIQMFYRDSTTSEWISLGNGTEFEIEKEKATGDHQVGGVARELSAYLPIILPDGKVLTDEDGKAICARFPTSEIEQD